MAKLDRVSAKEYGADTVRALYFKFCRSLALMPLISSAAVLRSVLLTQSDEANSSFALLSTTLLKYFVL